MASLATPALSQSHEYKGFIDLNAYPYLQDVDSDARFVINTASSLPHRMSYFGFINVIDQTFEETGQDKTIYFTEQNLRWQVAEGSPFDLTFQANLRSGSGNDRYRLGIRWRLNDTAWLASFFKALNMRYALNLHAIQFDQLEGTAWQLEHSFGMTFPYISDKLYLAGFIDHNFNEPLPDTIPDDPIVTEVQLGYEFAPGWFVISEYRVNQYRRSDVNNLAVGLEYKYVF